MMKTLFLLFILFLWAVPVQATTFWIAHFDAEDDNWSDNNLGTPGIMVGGSGPIQIDLTKSFLGAGSARYMFGTTGACLNSSPNFTDCGGFYNRTFPATKELWTRAYLFLSSDFIVGTSVTKIYQGSTNDVYSNWLLFHDGHPDFMLLLQNVPSGSGQSFPLYDGSQPLGVWTCVETHEILSDPGVANGKAEFYVNGSIVAAKNDVLSVAAGHTAMFTYEKVYRQYGYGYMWIDELAVGDTRIGCGGGGGTITGDTTPPAVPIGLAVH